MNPGNARGDYLSTGAAAFACFQSSPHLQDANGRLRGSAVRDSEFLVDSMPKMVCISPDGTRTPINSGTDVSLMEAAIDAGIKGIVGECGGACQCATCHIYVDAPWQGRLTPPSNSESEMLENTYVERLPTSRLSCQIRVQDSLDGLEFYLPERQV